MFKNGYKIALLMLLTLCSSALNKLCAQHNVEPTNYKYVDLVNPFVDSHKSRWFYFNSACRPFGMVSLSPDTDTAQSWKSGYMYGSDHIRCFSHIHNWQMSGVAVMPTVGNKGNLGMDDYQSKFSHEGEVAKPGYHRVKLTDYDITAELTSTTRVGFHRYTFPKSDESYVIFDTGAYLAHSATLYSEAWQISDTEIAGWEVMGNTIRRPKDTPVYFYAKVSKPIEEIVTWQENKLDEKVSNPVRTSGKNAGMALKFATKDGEQVMIKVAISYVSVEEARKNMIAECNGWDFEGVKQESFKDWNNWLGRIEVEGGSEQQQVKLYTDLWRSLLGRRILSDASGSYLDMTGDSPRIGQIPLGDNGKPKYNHHNFDAWWGSHWSLDILWTMAYPEMMDAFCNTMVDMYNNGGLLPRGPSGGNYTFVMIGDPSTSFIASAYNKGIRNYDAEKAYEGLRKNAFQGGIRDHAGYEHEMTAHSGGMKYYEEMGYVPEDIPNVKGMHTTGASMTLEYAYQDWCLAQMAKAMGKTADYELFMKRSKNYKNIWNPEVGYMHARNMDESWQADFNPLSLSEENGFCESNSAIYSHFVPHDMKGLIELNGGNKKYVAKLNSSFEKSEPYKFFRNKEIPDNNWVDYGNQPGTGMAHLFNHAGAPWLTQKWVRKVKAVYGGITPYDGYFDDEDQGQMGALGVLLGIGLFEVDGGCAERPYYEISSPIFDKVTIHLDNNYYSGDKFEIVTENNSDENMYIQSATLNGQKWNNCWFYHDEFAKGGKLEIKLGSKPNKKWGVSQLPPNSSL